MKTTCYLDDAKKYPVIIRQSSDLSSVTIKFPNFLENFENYLHVQIDEENPVPIKNNHTLTLPQSSDLKKITIIAKSKKEVKVRGNKDLSLLEANIIKFELPKKGDSLEAKSIKKKPLATYDIKTLVHTDSLPPIHNKNAHQGFQITTDLHTHFVAVPTAEDLFNLATENGTRPFYYPKDHLTEIGIDVEKYRKQENQQNLRIVLSKDECLHLKRNGLEKETRRLINPENISESNADAEFVDMNSLNDNDKKMLLEYLSIAPTTQTTFDDMEQYYKYRDPLIKNIESFEDLLRICAKNYHAAGIKDVSLSFSSRICKPEWLAIADRVLPELEEEYGVKMRFLVGISRLLDNAEQEDVIERFKAVADHPCIEGIDIYASEINSTYDFYLPLSKLALWCTNNGFIDSVVRIHAGETPYHPENVGAAVKFAYETGMFVRVGHGIFGSAEDEKLLDFFSKHAELRSRVIFEVNPDSNYSLNHVDNTQNHTLIELAKNNIPIAFGSDGAGLYYTDAKQLARHIDRLDVTLKDAEKVKTQVQQTEKHYSNVTRESYEYRENNLNTKLNDVIERELEIRVDEKIKVMHPTGEVDSSVRERLKNEVKKESYREIREKALIDYYNERAKQFKPKYWTAERQKSVRERKAIKEEKLLNALQGNNKITILKPTEEGKMSYPEGKIPIMITGGIMERTGEEQKKQISAFLKTLSESCDPNKVCFVTTGNEIGLQKLVHEQLGKAGFDIVGLISKNAKPKDISLHLTHVALGYEKWYDMHGFIAHQVEQHPDFQVVAIDGNMLTRHIIQTTVNAITQGDLSANNEQLYCVKGIPGAANDKAEHLPAQFSVSTLGSMLDKLSTKLERSNALKVSSQKAQTKFEKHLRSSKEDSLMDLMTHDMWSSADYKDKAAYFISLCKIYKIKIDHKLLKETNNKEINLFFKNGCKIDDPFVDKLIQLDNIGIIKKHLQHHFVTFGIPDLTEKMKQVKRRVPPLPSIEVSATRKLVEAAAVDTRKKVVFASAQTRKNVETASNLVTDNKSLQHYEDKKIKTETSKKKKGK